MTTIKKQRPTLIMSNVSLLEKKAFMRRSRVGMSQMPTKNHSNRKNNIWTRIPSTSPASPPLPPAMLANRAISTTPRMSSMMNTLTVLPTNRLLIMFKSLKAT